MENILFFLVNKGWYPPCGAEWGGPDPLDPPPGGNSGVNYSVIYILHFSDSSSTLHLGRFKNISHTFTAVILVQRYADVIHYGSFHYLLDVLIRPSFHHIAPQDGHADFDGKFPKWKVYPWWYKKPRKYEALNQCWVNVGPPSMTSAQHWPNISSMPHVWCEVRLDNVDIHTSIAYIPISAIRLYWKWNEWGFRPPLCTRRLNWVRISYIGQID